MYISLDENFKEVSTENDLGGWKKYQANENKIAYTTPDSTDIFAISFSDNEIMMQCEVEKSGPNNFFKLRDTLAEKNVLHMSRLLEIFETDLQDDTIIDDDVAQLNALLERLDTQQSTKTGEFSYCGCKHKLENQMLFIDTIAAHLSYPKALVSAMKNEITRHFNVTESAEVQQEAAALNESNQSMFANNPASAPSAEENARPALRHGCAFPYGI
ncbi:MAG: hypothetical protein SFW66_10885 [Gammaproteobacteria bacterium]|nr:hypothetical protein [Gammaproteobacteria bacterium]